MASEVVAWSRDAAKAAATTTAAQPNASSTTSTPAAASRRRRVQNGMRGIYGGGFGGYLPQPSPGLRQDLLKQRECAWIFGLAQPEQGLLAHPRAGVGAGDPDQRRHALITWLLGQREHGAFLYFERYRGVVQQFRKTTRRRLAGGLAEPEDRPAPGLARHARRAGEPQQIGPDGHAVRQHGGEDRLVSGVAGGARREVEQVAGGGGGGHGAQVGDAGARGPPGATHICPHTRDLAAALREPDPRRPRLARAARVVVVISADRDPMPAAPAVLAIERDGVAAVAAHAGAGGIGEPDFAVGRRRDPVGQAALQGER